MKGILANYMKGPWSKDRNFSYRVKINKLQLLDLPEAGLRDILVVRVKKAGLRDILVVRVKKAGLRDILVVRVKK